MVDLRFRSKSQKALPQGIVTVKTRFQIVRYIVIALLITIGVLGFRIASVAIYYYAPVARGILGLVVIYLAFQEASLSRSKNPLDGLFSFPKNIKYFVYTFIYSLIFYWALQQIYEMILFILWE